MMVIKEHLKSSLLLLFLPCLLINECHLLSSVQAWAAVRTRTLYSPEPPDPVYQVGQWAWGIHVTTAFSWLEKKKGFRLWFKESKKKRRHFFHSWIINCVQWLTTTIKLAHLTWMRWDVSHRLQTISTVFAVSSVVRLVKESLTNR